MKIHIEFKKAFLIIRKLIKIFIYQVVRRSCSPTKTISGVKDNLPDFLACKKDLLENEKDMKMSERLKSN